MSSIYQSYAKKQRLLDQLAEELKAMEDDKRLQVEIEFKEKLEKLMEEFNKTSKDVIELLDPTPMERGAANSSSSRRKRKLKIYKNPQTGEVVETRGGNHKTLKAWKNEHGEEAVEGWLVRTET